MFWFGFAFWSGLGRRALCFAGVVYVKRVSGVWFVWIGWFLARAATTTPSYLFNLVPRATSLGPNWFPVLRTYDVGIVPSTRL